MIDTKQSIKSKLKFTIFITMVNILIFLFNKYANVVEISSNPLVFITPQPLGAVQVFFHPWSPDGW